MARRAARQIEKASLSYVGAAADGALRLAALVQPRECSQRRFDAVLHVPRLWFVVAQRAAVIDFTAAYAEIEATYLVPGDSPIETIEEVDQPGNSISAPAGSAYGLWLENNISKAELRLIKGDAFAQFVDGDMSALGGLRSGLVKEVDKLPGARILDGQFTAVQQAVGVNKGRAEAFAWLLDFVEEIKASGFVADRIRHHGVEGQLSPAPSA